MAPPDERLTHLRKSAVDATNHLIALNLANMLKSASFVEGLTPSEQAKIKAAGIACDVANKAVNEYEASKH
jgi:hypothetical protein